MYVLNNQTFVTTVVFLSVGQLFMIIFEFILSNCTDCLWLWTKWTFLSPSYLQRAASFFPKLLPAQPLHCVSSQTTSWWISKVPITNSNLNQSFYFFPENQLRIQLKLDGIILYIWCCTPSLEEVSCFVSFIPITTCTNIWDPHAVTYSTQEESMINYQGEVKQPNPSLSIENMLQIIVGWNGKIQYIVMLANSVVGDMTVCMVPYYYTTDRKETVPYQDLLKIYVCMYR